MSLELPRISNPWGGRTVPARTYSDLFFARFNADFVGGGTLKLYSRDYSYEAKEADPLAPEREVTIDGLWEYASTRPLVAQWLGMGVMLGTLVLNEQKLLADKAAVQASIIGIGAEIVVIENHIEADPDNAALVEAKAAKEAAIAAAQGLLPAIDAGLAAIAAQFAQV
jgi:hypothetical protein